ncbi:MAG: hypothetical protein NVS9B15_00500 [Acidobacteriaceae bacterium]
MPATSLSPNMNIATVKRRPATQASSEQFTSPPHALQRPFERGVAYLHSFWYEEAEKQFRTLVSADPSCAMAHWGVAMSMFHQLWDRPDESAIGKGAAELALARSNPPRTDREQRYINALSAFYNTDKSADHVARAKAYSAKMQELYAASPRDTEAGAFYALSLLSSESPGDTSLQNERGALAILLPLFSKYPNHPGLAHYIIHTCDTPSLARQGLAAAREYAKIAPSSPHAVHMPGHIFARLGLWQEDIASNLASIQATHYAMAHHQGGAGHQLHAMDFLVYAYLQTGQEAEAKALVDSTPVVLKEIASSDVPDPMMGHMDFYTTEFTAIYALETRDWQSAAALAAPSDPMSLGRIIGLWANTIGDARQHRSDAARSHYAAFQEALERMKHGSMSYMVEEMQVPQKELEGWLAYSQQDVATAISRMREAADLQDRRGQAEVDIPAREMLADILLESGSPQQALTEYTAALQLSPNRFNGLYNAGRAAERSGHSDVAARFYRTLVAQTSAAGSTPRPELAHAREFLSQAQLARR